MMSNDSTINVVTTKQQSEQNDKIAFNTFRTYITTYHTYQLLYHKGHYQMMSNDNTINVKTKKQSEQNGKFVFNTLRIYIKIYHTYML